MKRKTLASTKDTTALLPPRYDLLTTAGKASLYREQASLLSDFGISAEHSLHANYDDWCLRVSEAEKHAATLLSLRELKGEIESGCERLAECIGKAKEVAEVVREHQEAIKAVKVRNLEEALEEMQKVR